MPDAVGAPNGAMYIDAPRDPRLKALYEYWDGLRDGRTTPARGDFDPSAIPSLLPHIIIYGRGEDGGYTIRLVGEAVVNFVGRNATGNPAGVVMPPRAAELMVQILDTVAAERTPKFRAGQAHWHPDKGHRDFEACFLPLSGDNGRITTVLGGIAFPNPPY